MSPTPLGNWRQHPAAALPKPHPVPPPAPLPPRLTPPPHHDAVPVLQVGALSPASLQRQRPAPASCQLQQAPLGAGALGRGFKRKRGRGLIKPGKGFRGGGGGWKAPRNGRLVAEGQDKGAAGGEGGVVLGGGLGAQGKGVEATRGEVPGNSGRRCGHAVRMHSVAAKRAPLVTPSSSTPVPGLHLVLTRNNTAIVWLSNGRELRRGPPPPPHAAQHGKLPLLLQPDSCHSALAQRRICQRPPPLDPPANHHGAGRRRPDPAPPTPSYLLTEGA